jgi:hypothetical protein
MMVSGASGSYAAFTRTEEPREASLRKILSRNRAWWDEQGNINGFCPWSNHGCPGYKYVLRCSLWCVSVYVLMRIEKVLWSWKTDFEILMDSHVFIRPGSEKVASHCHPPCKRLRALVYIYICITNSVAFSPQSNYTHWSTAAAGEVVPTFVGRGVCVVRAANPHGR